MTQMDHGKQRLTVLTRAGRLFSKGMSYIFSPETANQFKITRQFVHLPDLPETFENLRVVQLSDIHFYEFSNSEYQQRVVDAVNGLKPDVVVTTGDIIHYGQHYLDMSDHYLSQIQASIGKWSCMGNHDYSDDHRGGAVKAMLEDAGYDVLVNRAVALEKGGKRLWLSGVDDFCKGAPDAQKAFHKVEDDTVHIALAHNPRLAPYLDHQENAPDIILAGHTHGGQIDHFLVNMLQKNVFKQPYQYGWFDFNRSKMFVTSGVGSAVVSWHIPPHFDFALYPFRINTMPEIAVFDLTSQPLVTMPNLELLEVAY